jgi:hypothetical protein
MREPWSRVEGRASGVVPTVPSQSLPSLLYVLVESKVLSARPTKSCKRPYVVGHVLAVEKGWISSGLAQTV